MESMKMMNGKGNTPLAPLKGGKAPSLLERAGGEA